MPVPTIADVLKQSGYTQEQIDALDAKLLAGMKTALSGAEQAEKDALTKQQEAAALAKKAEDDRKAAETAAAAALKAKEEAELQQRSVDSFWKETYNPSVKAWEEEKAKLAKAAADATAKAAFYETQRKTYLETLGIDPANAPEFKPEPAATNTTTVTPGTPTVVDPNQIVARATAGLNTISDIEWKYRLLYGGQTMPMSPSALIQNADAMKLTPEQYAARTFKFAEKEEEARVAAARKHDEEIAAAAVAQKEADHKAELERIQNENNAKLKTLTEKNGQNPDVREPINSARFDAIRQAEKVGERKSPLGMSQEERRKMTFTNVHKALEERAAANV